MNAYRNHQIASYGGNWFDSAWYENDDDENTDKGGDDDESE